jgi:hypothetical protein
VLADRTGQANIFLGTVMLMMKTEEYGAEEKADCKE